MFCLIGPTYSTAYLNCFAFLPIRTDIINCILVLCVIINITHRTVIITNHTYNLQTTGRQTFFIDFFCNLSNYNIVSKSCFGSYRVLTRLISKISKYARCRENCLSICTIQIFSYISHSYRDLIRSAFVPGCSDANESIHRLCHRIITRIILATLSKLRDPSINRNFFYFLLIAHCLLYSYYK